MQLSTRLTLALTLTTAVLLGLYGARQLHREEAELRRAVEYDFRLLGTALQVAVENALRDRQPEDIQEIFDSLKPRAPATDVFVFDEDGSLRVSSRGRSAALSPLEEEVPRVLASRAPSVHFAGPGGLGYLVAVLPLSREGGATGGALGMVRPLEDVREDLAATRGALFFSLLSQVGGIALVGWGLVLHYVRRPLGRLVAAMSAVRAGNLRTSVPVDRKDELGNVAGEFNMMLEELSAVRGRLAQEEESRRVLEAEVRRLDKLVTVGQLAAGVAHEIGSPLQILNGRARALAARGDVAADVRRNAEILVEQSDRITRIVQQMLDVARRRPARLEAVDARATAQTILELVALDARRKEVRMEFHAPELLPRVRADVDQLQQVVLNLLTNALKATPRGGLVTLSLAAASFHAPGSGVAREGVALEVQDTGVGMGPEVLARLSEPFFSGWNDASGNGLGLAVVRSIVAEHGGTSTVTSREGEGSRITIHLPAVPKQEEGGATT